MPGKQEPRWFIIPHELQLVCDKVGIIFSVFEENVKNTKEALRQISDLAKLKGTSSEIFDRTWFMQDFIDFTKTILNDQAECDIKNFVTEEIHLCRERFDLIRISSPWKYPSRIDENVKVLCVFLAEELKVQ